MTDQPDQTAMEASSEERSVLELIRDIKSGSIEAKLLSTGNRQACVAHMTGEGLSVAEIATVLRILGRDADLQSNCLPTSVSSARWSPPMLVYRRMGRDLDPSPLGERPSGNLARTAPACARAR